MSIAILRNIVGAVDEWERMPAVMRAQHAGVALENPAVRYALAMLSANRTAASIIDTKLDGREQARAEVRGIDALGTFLAGLASAARKEIEAAAASKAGDDENS